ncbi:hypothetical protein L2E82_49746 [Cichorium intybus]|uniref:Uncharacterized protein n=1 Tax=Cichorium intybus TaxID=13427 RepID=A0ACB8Z087_CICIN|nr:hypothetical protein L2E82_49746 [Cichorium intybus]
MEKQRNTQYENNFNSEINFPIMETRLQIEKHAAKVYTNEIFKIVQQEIIDSVWLCSHDSIQQHGDVEVCIVKDERKISITKEIREFDDENEYEDGNLESNEQVTEYKEDEKLANEKKRKEDEKLAQEKKKEGR